MPGHTTYTATVPRRISRNAINSKWADPELEDGCELEHNPDANPSCELLADPAPLAAPASVDPVGVVLPESEPGKAPVVVADGGTSDGARTVIQPSAGPRIEGQDFADGAMTLGDLLTCAEEWRDRGFDLGAKVKAWTGDAGFVRRLALIEDEPERAPSGFLTKVADTDPTKGDGPADVPPAPPVEPAQVTPPKQVIALHVQPRDEHSAVRSQLAQAFGRGRGRVPR